jgi:Zinc knuckle
MEENSFSSPKPSGRQDARRERKTNASTTPIEEDVTVEVVDVGTDNEEVEVMKIGPAMIKKLSKLDKSKIKYYNCNEYEHFAKECPKPNRREQLANLVSKQGDDEPALLMAEVCDFIQTIPTEEVLLHEDMMMPKSNSN